MSSSKSSPPTSVIVALTVVALAVIGAGTLMVLTVEQSEIPQAWLGVFVGMLGTLVTALVTLSRTEQVHNKVDRVLNGAMDEKIERGVRKVLKERDGSSE